MKKVAIIGCGPAGLIAAHTADRMGAEVDLFSMKHKSPIGGAQYLHQEVLGDHYGDIKSEVVYTFKMGSEAGYAEKVYGDSSAPVSFANYRTGPNVGYSLQETYDWLWDKWSDRINNIAIGHGEIQQMTTDDEYDCVFSSIPRKAICLKNDPDTEDRHSFDSQEILLVPIGMSSVKNTIIYSGRPEDAWYRTSFLDGEGWTEYSTATLNEEAIKHCQEAGGKFGYKPLETDCDCHGEKFVPIGRFGRWEKSALLHHVVTQVWDRLS